MNAGQRAEFDELLLEMKCLNFVMHVEGWLKRRTESEK